MRHHPQWLHSKLWDSHSGSQAHNACTQPMSERKRSSLNKSSKKSRQRSGDRAAPDIQEQRELTRMMTQRTSKSRRWPKGTKRFTETMPSIQVDSAVQGNIPKGGHKTKQKATVRLRREGWHEFRLVRLASAAEGFKVLVINEYSGSQEMLTARKVAHKTEALHRLKCSPGARSADSSASLASLACVPCSCCFWEGSLPWLGLQQGTRQLLATLSSSMGKHTAKQE